MEVRELIEEIVKALVDNPEQVHCAEVHGTHSCVLEPIFIHPSATISRSSTTCPPCARSLA